MVSDVCGVVPAVMSTRSSVLPSSWKVSLATIGASFTGSTVMVNICGADVFTPPFAVPPLSCSTSVIVAVPNAFGPARVGERAGRRRHRRREAEQAGVAVVLHDERQRLPGFVRRAGLISVAKAATVCGPASSVTVGRGAREHEARRVVHLVHRQREGLRRGDCPTPLWR